jgi:hypothetical protein
MCFQIMAADAKTLSCDERESKFLPSIIEQVHTESILEVIPGGEVVPALKVAKAVAASRAHCGQDNCDMKREKFQGTHYTRKPITKSNTLLCDED